MTVRRRIVRYVGGYVAFFAAFGTALGAGLSPITIDYPQSGSIFPPEITPPTFLWRDPAASAAFWRIEVAFGDGSPPIRATSRGERMRIGEMDARCVSPTNRPPQLTTEQSAARTWIPDADTWTAVKKRSAGLPATVTITGYASESSSSAASSGRVTIATVCEVFGVKTAFQEGVENDPVNQLAAYHVDLSSTAFGIQEENHFPPQVQEMLPGTAVIRKGYMYGSGRLGLGIDINEEMAAKYPVAEPRNGGAYGTDRSLDGTVLTP